MNNYDDIIIKIHDIARSVENNSLTERVGYELRRVADQLSELVKKERLEERLNGKNLS
jgi:hypothetical protein